MKEHDRLFTELKEDSRIQKMSQYIQHGKVSTYDHCCRVADLSSRINCSTTIICMTGMKRTGERTGCMASGIRRKPPGMPTGTSVSMPGQNMSFRVTCGR